MPKRINSKTKGKIGELEFAALLRENGYDARRGVQYSGGGDSPDVVCQALPIHFEVKRVQNLNIYDAINQAHNDYPHNDKLKVVAHRKNNKCWLFTMTSIDFFRLLRYVPQHERLVNL